MWACRKGNVEIVDLLLKAGANVDTAGMYSWTGLLVVSHRQFVTILQLCHVYDLITGCFWGTSRSDSVAVGEKTEC